MSSFSIRWCGSDSVSQDVYRIAANAQKTVSRADNWSRAVAVFLCDTLSKYGLRAALRAADRTNDSPSFRLERLRRASSTLAPMDRRANRVSARVPIVNKTNVSGVFYPNEVIAILPLVTGSQWV